MLFFFCVKEVQSVSLYAQQNCSAAMLKLVLFLLLYFILAVFGKSETALSNRGKVWLLLHLPRYYSLTTVAVFKI